MEELKHSDVCTHISNKEDQDILTRRLFDVNMRLFHSSPEYRKIVLGVCEYIVLQTKTKREGYKKPHGFSGANAGIPFNIIGYWKNWTTNPEEGGSVNIMINPKILKFYGKKIISKSNCGSIILKEPVDVVRDEFIDVEFYNTSGKKVLLEGVSREQCGLTIQHEIEHNNGILILDKMLDSEKANQLKKEYFGEKNDSSSNAS